MNADPVAVLRSQQLAYVGRVSAGFTHEFSNHLAVINESAGLLADLLAISRRQGAAIDHDRCLRIIDTINERVAIAAELTGLVNRFSHRLRDEEPTLFSTTEVLAELVALMERFARLAGVRLVLVPAAGCQPERNYPALLQFVCFSLVMTALSSLAEGGVLKVRVEAGDRVRITLLPEGEDRPAEAGATGDSSILNLALELMEARLIMSSLENGSPTTVLELGSL